MTAAQRRERQRIIQEALLAGLVHSQDDVVRLLKKSNIKVTQATASRDLDEIGAVKGKGADGRTIYRLAEAGKASTDDLALEIALAGSLLVLKTRPGAAQLIAARIDRANLKGIVGTIAGDDTIFIAMKDGVPAKRVRSEILDVASGATTIVRKS